MSARKVSEILAAAGVIGSMLFVGYELRQSNLQARASAYQAIGTATAEFHSDWSDELLRQSVETQYAEAVARWDPVEWERYLRHNLAGLRLAEMVMLQIDQKLLPPDAMERLGYSFLRTRFLSWPGNACLWPLLSTAGSISLELVAYVERTPAANRHECQLDLKNVRDEWVQAGAPG
jgi:hypothetical protein